MKNVNHIYFFALETDEVDDLLDFIEEASRPGTSKQSSAQKPPSRQPEKTEKAEKAGGFFDDLVEDDQGTSSYIPSMSQTRQSRTGGGLNSDLKSKMGELFGIKSDKKGKEDEDDAGIPAMTRPFTSEPRINATSNKTGFNQTGFSDDLGSNEGGIDELSMPFSRRKGRGKTLRERESSRPFTSPGDIAGNVKDEESRIGTRDNVSNQGGFDLTSNYEAKSIQNKDENEDEDHSEYIPTGLARPVSRGGDKKFTKSRIGGDSGDFGAKKLLGSAFGDDKSDTPSILAPKKSVPETGGYGELSTSNITAIHADTTGVTRRARGSHTEILDLGKPPMTKFEEKMASLGRPATGTGIPQAQPKTEISLPGFDDGVSRQGANLQGNEKSFLGEETIKKILKDTEEYYKSTLEDLKKHHREEKERWEAAHTKEIEMLKREKQTLLDQMEINVQRERDRLKELHKLEMESKDKMHSYEIDRQKHLLEEQTESLKKQLEAQIKLNALAEEVRSSSNKLQTLTERIESERRIGDHGKKSDLDQRERLIEEREMKIKTDLEILEREKQRYDRLLMELDERESESMRKIDREKDQISQEYKRLSELQESVKNGELEKRRELNSEKTQLETMRVRLEKENLEIKEEYRRKYHELEIQIMLFEEQKREFTKRQTEDEKSLKKKIEEVDAIRKKLAYEEADLLKKLKDAETRELQLVKMMDELQTKLDLYNMEKSTFESEKMKVYEIAKKAREESEAVNKFKMEFDREKEKNQRMKIELDSYATALQAERLKLDEERSSLTLLQKTLEGMRYGYVKEYNTTGPGFVGKPPIPSQRTTFANEFPSKLNETMPQTHRPGTAGLGTNEFPSRLNETMANTHRPGTTGLMAKSASSKNLQDFSDTTRPSTNRVSANTNKYTSERRRSNVSSFDLSRYMEELKHIDKSNSINKEYITREKENLLRNRIDIEAVHLTRPKTSRSESSSRY